MTPTVDAEPPTGARRAPVVAVALTAAVAAAAALVVTTVGPGHPTDTVVVAAAATATAGIGAHLGARAVVQRQRQRERAANRRLVNARRALRDEQADRLALRELDRALDLAADEATALDIVREAFSRHLPDRPLELHLVDRCDPVLALAASSGLPRAPATEQSSPWESLAARTSGTLVYESTSRVDVCPHLRRRCPEPCSAVAVPLTARGRILGVLYAFGPDGERPHRTDVAFLEDMAAVIAARLAVLRVTIEVADPGAIDTLTGLGDRTATQRAIVGLLRDRVPFSLAVADVDGLGRINDLLGRDAGDTVLRAVADVARRHLRPGDVVGRIGDDEFVFVLLRTRVEAAERALERLREEVVLVQNQRAAPGFTLSVGIAGSRHGEGIDAMMRRAGQALARARAAGGDRIVVDTRLDPVPGLDPAP